MSSGDFFNSSEYDFIPTVIPEDKNISSYFGGKENGSKGL
jgi:hypothetical protein